MFLGTYVREVPKFTLQLLIHETANALTWQETKPIDLDH